MVATNSGRAGVSSHRSDDLVDLLVRLDPPNSQRPAARSRSSTARTSSCISGVWRTISAGGIGYIRIVPIARRVRSWRRLRLIGSVRFQAAWYAGLGASATVGSGLNNASMRAARIAAFPCRIPMIAPPSVRVPGRSQVRVYRRDFTTARVRTESRSASPLVIERTRAVLPPATFFDAA